MKEPAPHQAEDLDDNHGISFTAETQHPALDENPRITNSYYHLIRELRRNLSSAVNTLSLTSQHRILDYGCATMRYRDLFPADADYVGADLPGNELAKVLLEDDGRVPLPDASFDVIFSTQVLEHVEEPQLYLAECRRLLKPGGQLILSTHGQHVFHPCPHDYWRWTFMGLARSIKSAGFCVDNTIGVIGGIPASLQLLQDQSVSRLPAFLRPLIYALFQSLIVFTDSRHTPEGKLRNACILLSTATAV